MKSKRLRRVLSLLIFATILCGLVTIATFGKNLPALFVDAIPFEGPYDADSSGQYTAVVDRESRRVLILNDNYELTGIVDCDTLNAPLEAITDVCVADKTIYVAGVRYLEDSEVIQRERVVAYNTGGTSEQVVYDTTSTELTSPTIKALDSAGDGVYIVRVLGDGESLATQTVSLIYADRSETHSIEDFGANVVSTFDVGYSNKANVFETISIRGILNDTLGTTDAKDASATKTSSTGKDSAKASTTPTTTLSSLDDCVFTSLDVADNGDTYLYDDVRGNICYIAKDGELQWLSEGSGYSNLHTNGYTLTACNRKLETVLVKNLDDGTYKKVANTPLSARLSVFVYVVWACRTFLILLALVLMVQRVWHLAQQNKLRKIIPLVGSMAVVFAVALAVGYISYGAYQAMMQARSKEINVFADYQQSIIASQLSSSMEKCNDRDIFRKTDSASADAIAGLTAIDMQVNGLSRVSTLNGLGMYSTVYGMDDKGVFYLVGSSEDQVVGTNAGAATKAEEIAAIFKNNDVGPEIRTGSTLRDETLYRLVRIASTDGKSTIGVVEVGSRMKSFVSAVAGEQAQRVLTLLVMVLVLYLSYSELAACAECFHEFRELQHHHDSIAILTRPFSFFVTLLSSIDSVMSILIARALISQTGMQGSGLMLALPSVMMGIGLAMGQIVYSMMGSRVVIQKIMKRGATAMVIAAGVTAAVVWMGNFWLYCMAKLIMAVPFGLLYTLSYSLPRRADTRKVRMLAAGGIKRTDTSAAALGTVLGGVAAQSLGNAWVYVLVAVTGIIVLMMANLLLPPTSHPLEHEAHSVRSPRAAIIRLLTCKTTLPIVLLVMLPAILAAGYNSFLFPLFSADLGIDTSSINNIFVLGQLVVYVSITGIEKLEKRYDKWWLALAAVTLLGVTFLLFSFNTSLEWAVVTIALVGLLCKLSDAWKALWPRSARANGLTTGVAVGAMFSVRSVLLIVQPLLLGALLSLGDRGAVIILGIVCLVCALAFYCVTRTSPLSPSDDEQSAVDLFWPFF